MGVYNTHILPFLMGVKRAFFGVGFNGTSQYGRLEHAAALHPTEAVTLSFRTRFTTEANTVVMEKSTNNSSYFIQTSGPTTTGFTGITGQAQGRLIFSPNFASNGTPRLATPVINDGQWRRVLFQNSFTTATGEHAGRSAVEGVIHAAAVKTGAAIAVNTNPYFFAARSGTSIFCPIDMAEYAMWNVFLNNEGIAAEEKTLKDYALGLTAKPAGLICYFPNEPVAVTGQAWTHEWVDMVSGYVLKLYNAPTTLNYTR